ncbi:MAG: selenide, water dikinase [Thermomicrobiales bacterium]|jgi:selenide,water dikinase|nr:selenide, water dikinase [Thermomicrobiales bacterium]MEA2527588.1 selenide, water dikinase [Thermomicrobiales bacterium]MEA2594746.1 selenide, water dikinase [Thermomicrobiales bacterium]
MGPEALAQVLRPLTRHNHPNLIVGLQTSDDAAVYRLSDEQAIIQTVDFFPPVVDDAFAYGAISAANSMSDVYAMGGEVLFALNIAAFPDDLPHEILSRIFEGGASKVVEAGAVIAGGHTVTDDEPKYGLCVTGTIHPDRILTKAGARPGDRLFLTKPLGTGVITTAHKNRVVSEEHLQAALDSMLRLNRGASLAARTVGPHACTDVTGFGLLGHGFEVAEKSGVGLQIAASRVPLLPGALEYVARGQQPGGLGRNRDFYAAEGVKIAADVPPDLATLLYDPQTSGGLLLSVAAEEHEALLSAFAAAGESIWEIGEVIVGRGVTVTP